MSRGAFRNHEEQLEIHRDGNRMIKSAYLSHEPGYAFIIGKFLSVSH